MNPNPPASSPAPGASPAPASQDAPTEAAVSPPAAPAGRPGGLRPSGLRLEAFWGTDPGRTRDHNEDTISGTPPDYAPAATRGHLFVVADGMGGHNAGEIASSEAVKRVYSRYYADTDPDLYRSLERAMRTANNELFLQAQADPAQHGMGTTMTAAVIEGNHLTVAHVGDSRLYLIRGGKIELLTHDHSWVEEQVRAGVLTQLQAKSHPQRNVITRALATAPDVRVDREERDLQPGDVIVYSSDGLNTEVDDAQIAAHATKASSAAEAVRRLIQLANDNGGEDNVSVGVIRVPEATGGPAAAPPRNKRRMVVIIGGAAALALIGGLIWAGSSLLGRGGGPSVTITVAATPHGSPTVTPADGGVSAPGTSAASALGSMTATLTTAPGAPTVTLQPTHTPGLRPASVATNTPRPGGSAASTPQESKTAASPSSPAKKPAPVLLRPASGDGQSEASVTLSWELPPGISLRQSEAYAVLLWAKGGPDDGRTGLDLPALNDACNPEKRYTATTYSAQMEGRGNATYRWAVAIVDTSQPEPRGRCAVVSEMPSPFEFAYEGSSPRPSEPTPAPP